MVKGGEVAVEEPEEGIADQLGGAGRGDETSSGLLGEAMAHYRAKRYPAAAECGRRAVEREPDRPVLWNALGIFLRKLGRSGEAIQALRHASALAPDDASIWSNLGNLLSDVRSIRAAITCYERATELAPYSSLFHHNMGAALLRSGQAEQALSALNQALVYSPGNPYVLFDRALAHLHMGNSSAGWVDYEARFHIGELPPRKFAGKPWRGQAFRGQRLLIVPEQGMGDAIWVARYLPLVKGLGGEVILEARPELIPLFEENALVDRVTAVGKTSEDAEWYVYQCSLPGIFATRPLPDAPYLKASPARVEKLRPIIKPDEPGLKIGVVWSGSVTFKNNRERAAPLRAFLEHFAMPGIRLFSLQKGPPEAELRKIEAAPITDLAPHLEHFADTAAALTLLDMVIMTDSSVAHLGGAMGKDVWVLLGRGAHWLWQGDSETSPWYPSLRLFRWKGSWPDVFDHASAGLLEKIFSQ